MFLSGNPLQYSFLESSTDRRAGQAAFPGITQSWAGLCDFHFHYDYFHTKAT